MWDNRGVTERWGDGAFDVLIIGAGINGCGLFRHLTLSGLRCLLIDRSDFSAGTSAASSRMAHGGLRYLEGGNVTLVQESLIERNRLFNNAGHMVHPAEVIIPYSSWLSGLVAAPLNMFARRKRSFRRGGALIHIGLWLYDRFGRPGHKQKPHRRLSRTQLDHTIPGLAAGFIGAGGYTDGLVRHPERLALELVLDGLRASAASVALTYCDLSADAKGMILHVRGQDLPLQARVIVNATGPNIDQVNRVLGLDTRHVIGSQGLHLVLNAPSLAQALGDRIVYFETADGRLCLAYQMAGQVFTGTTDQLTSQPEGEPDLSRDAPYILANLNKLFPGAALTETQIVSSSFGVRAFAAIRTENAGAVPRDHSIVEDMSVYGPVLSMVGGKWTTFRSFAEDTAKALTRHLPDLKPIDTTTRAIGGGHSWPEGRAARLRRLGVLGLAPIEADALAERYGSDDRIDHFLSMPGGLDPVIATPLLLRAELVMFCRDEQATTLIDIFYRRWRPGFAGLPEDRAITAVADVVAEELGWDAATTGARIADLQAEAHARTPGLRTKV